MLKNVVSSGKPGAELDALKAAHKFGITTGGHMQKGPYKSSLERKRKLKKKIMKMI